MFGLLDIQTNRNVYLSIKLSDSVLACARFCVLRVEEIICEVKFSAISFYFLSKVGCAVITEAKFVK